MNIYLKKAALALAIVGAAGVAQADVVGGQSDTSSSFYVDTATFGTVGAAGAGVDGQINDEVASFSHFARPAYYDSATDVYHVSGRELVADGAPGSGQYDHSGIGVWSFAKVGSQDVWFGEWDGEATTGAIGTKVAGTHNVWYVGEDGNVASTLPSTTATYTVRSINNYTGSALPTSTLTANFTGGSSGSASSTGDIAFTGGTFSTVGNDVRLAASGVSVASSGGTSGSLTGNFYGTGASAVAGIVTFANRDQNTAFGGTKN